MNLLNSLRTLAKIGLLAALVAFAASVALAQAKEDNPFGALKSEALSYFIPIENSVISVGNSVVTADMGADDGVKVGMRFTITRKGVPFLHPITKEPLGKLESVVGRAQVLRVESGSSELKVLSGEPAKGDVLRLSSAKVKMLFFQSSEVDWNISEAYYQRIKKDERFEIIDTSPGVMTDSQIVMEGRRAGALVVLVLSSTDTEGGTILNQRFLWVSDGEELFTQDVFISSDLAADLSIGSDLFTPKRASALSVELEYRASFLRTGDFDGDGETELLLGSWSGLSFYKTEVPLTPALGGLEFKRLNGELNIWMDVEDIDGDKADEILVVSKREDRITSRIFKYQDNTLVEIFKAKRFLRLVNGGLYAQKYLIGTGYGGDVFPVEMSGVKTSEPLKIPEGVNIYDFHFLRNAEDETIVAVYDDRGRLNLYNEKGALLWRSTRGFGSGIVEFDKVKSDSIDDTKTWVVHDRIHVAGRTSYVINRIPVYRGSKGIGHRKSQILGLRWMGPTLKGTAVVDNVPGSILDFEIIDNKVYVLAKPWLGVDTKKLLKGQSPFVSKLYIYSMKGP